MQSAAHADVAILGGGLAGLTLALQLRARFPQLDVLVLERRRHPVPEAAHKVGESSVEIAAHYFDTVLGLKEHMTTRQLKKFGFRFFFSDGREDIDQVAELGASRYLATPSYQIDRGIFENHLAEVAQSQGVRFLDGSTVDEVFLDDHGAHHEIRYRSAGASHAVSARWLIDASGREGIVKRRLGLAEANAHDANAIWFRIGTRIDVNDWSSDRAWLDRCDPPYRWLSTNHLVGEGYWAWLIPLSSGSHSVGIVCDAKLHPLRTMNTYAKAMDWFRKHQPRLARALEDKEHLLQDFIALRRFSYGCRQVFSGSRWALTGEAGVFLDPFYSPGGDFIAIGNTYITELIAKDLAGEPIEHLARIYERFYLSFYESTLTLYVDQYPMFGDAEVMPVKVIWDYTYYWGVLCQLFFQHRLTDLAMLGRVRREMTAAMALNAAMQRFLREWSRVSAKRNAAVMLDQARLEWFAELNRGLRDALDDEAFRERLRETTTQLRDLAREIVERAVEQHPALDAAGVLALLAGAAA
ncbi:MAG TPA: tryptophan 7-halogenase, partial [Steroidobacteraceae bacterium]|nr:tryptophan 7-halogenase [Steroidobacteraceae bacterium]